MSLTHLFNEYNSSVISKSLECLPKLVLNSLQLAVFWAPGSFCLTIFFFSPLFKNESLIGNVCVKALLGHLSCKLKLGRRLDSQTQMIVRWQKENN